MDILICSRLFFPENQIGAVRITNFAKYLNEFGHNVSVLTESADDILVAEPNASSIKVINVKPSKVALKLMKKVAVTVESRQRGHIDSAGNKIKNKKKLPPFYYKLKESLFQLYHLFLEYDWYLQARKVMNQNLRNKKFDVLISSYSPMSSVLIARYLKKNKNGNYWVADLRDSMDKEQYSKTINWIYNHFQKDMVRKADVITVVSKGQAKMLQRSIGERLSNGDMVKILYNGYEKSVNTVPSEHAPVLTNGDHKLIITYTGSLYKDRSDMSLLFEALRELIDEKRIDLNNIEVHYAGQNSPDFAAQSISYDLQQITIDHGFLSRAESIKLQQSSDILIALCWNTEKELGILSGKFFEYLQSFKPIIGIISGDVANSELSELINELDVGIGCEYIRKGTDLKRLKSYLLFMYNGKIKTGLIEFSPNIEKVKSFHYKKIVEQLEKICIELPN